jgi:hypothetical protein
MQSWWPDGRRQRLIAQAEAFTAARAGRVDAIDRLIAIAQDETYPPLVRANAVGYLGQFTDPRASSMAVRAARNAEPAIRLTAVAALRDAAGSSEDSSATVLSALADPRRAVRIAAAVTIAERNGRDLQPAEFVRFRAASDEVVSWTRRHQDDAELQRLQGLVQLLGGNINSAGDALAISLAHNPESSQTKFLLGVARRSQGRSDEARRLWSEIPRGDPHYESAQRQLKTLGSK